MEITAGQFQVIIVVGAATIAALKSSRDNTSAEIVHGAIAGLIVTSLARWGNRVFCS